jgi:hypothetical protein
MARSEHSRLKCIGLILAVPAVAIAAGLLFIASKLGGDEKVMSDIDRHFASLDSSSSYAGFYEEEKRTSRSRKGRTSAAFVPSTEPSIGAQPSALEKARPRKSNRVRARATPAPTSDSAAAWPGVRRVAPGTYRLTEALVAQARQNPRSFIPGVRARLVSRDGKPLGFQLDGIGPASALRAIGLGNGDVLLAINGFSLKTADEALLAATSLRFADKFRVDILRGPNRHSCYYRVDSP